MTIRIATGGKAGAGKDFILNILVHAAAGRDGLVHLKGFGDLVREEWRSRHPGREPRRKDLQDLGALARAVDPDYWAEYAAAWARRYNGYDDSVILGFSGVRFENEIEALHRVGFRVGLIEADEETRKHRLFHRDGRWWTDDELCHPTETALDTIPRDAWDFVIRND